MMLKEIISQLKKNANPKNVEGMARFGINPKNTFGVSMPFLRSMGKKIGKDHKLALELWDSGYHEAKILAGLIDDPKLVTEAQMEKWVKDFDSWDVCDQVCMNLFDRTPYTLEKISQWTKNEKEFIRRAGFVLMAVLAVHDKKMPDGEFIKFLSIIKKYSTDERNFVRKAVNWALRQIGKRNSALNKAAIKASEEILKIDSKTAKWIASDAIRELKSPAKQNRLKKT